MIRRALCAAAVLAFALPAAARADEIGGVIKKIEGGKITFAKFNREEKKLEEAKTYTLASNVKVRSATFNKEERKIVPGTALEGGLKNERLKNIPERGMFAQIVTNDEGQVTEIRVFPAKKPRD
jgi:hypothetical protein